MSNEKVFRKRCKEKNTHTEKTLQNPNLEIYIQNKLTE